MKVVLASEVNNNMLMVSEIHGKFYVQKSDCIDSSITEHNSLESLSEEVSIEEVFKSQLIEKEFVEFYKNQLLKNGTYVKYEYAGKDFIAIRYIEKIINLVNYMVKNSEEDMKSITEYYSEFKINVDNLFVIPYAIEVRGDRLEVETFTQYFDGTKYHTLDDEPSLKIQNSIIKDYDNELYDYLTDVYDTAKALLPVMERVSTTVLYGTKNSFDTIGDGESLAEIIQCLCYRVTSPYRLSECKYFIK